MTYVTINEAGKKSFRGVDYTSVPQKPGFQGLSHELVLRFGFKRSSIAIAPGLYAVGEPDGQSRVFVTSNYKMSFDHLRRSLKGFSAWIMVVDTKGINVWCAAGKGTFATDGVVSRIKECRLDEVVDHKEIILPQLSAVGVSGYEVKRMSGFRVVFGPVRTSDINEFMKNDMKSTPEMRRVSFDFIDRLVLTPVEVKNWIYLPVITIIILFAVAGIYKGGYSFDLMISKGYILSIFALASYFAGTVAAPVLLPFIPGRMFSLKGFLLGSVVWLGLVMFFVPDFFNAYTLGGLYLLVSSAVSFLLMQFTGSTPLTGITGVEIEIQKSFRFQIGGYVSGLIFILSGALL